MKSDRGARTATVLVVTSDPETRRALHGALGIDSHEMAFAGEGSLDVDVAHKVRPDVLVLDTEVGGMGALEFLEQLRMQTRFRSLPVLFVVPYPAVAELTRTLALDGEDFVTTPVDTDGVRRRVTAKLERMSAERRKLAVDVASGMVKPRSLHRELGREHERVVRGGSNGALAMVRFDEAPLEERFGGATARSVARRIAARALMVCRPLDVVGRTAEGEITILMPDTSPSEAERRLRAITECVAAEPISTKGERFRLAVDTGYVALADVEESRELLGCARAAAAHPPENFEVVPHRWEAAITPTEPAESSRHDGPVRHERRSHEPVLGRLRAPSTVIAALLAGVAAPVAVLWQLDLLGVDVLTPASWAVAGVLAVAAVVLFGESMGARRRTDPAESSGITPPTATAIIGAHLPDDGVVLLETVQRFREIEYPDLEIIVAYDTPSPVAIERELVAVANDDPRVVPIRVQGSRSMAQNVNAGLQHAGGAFVGIFEADHHPDPDAFRRAWRWLSTGDDAVCGRTVLRNGGMSHVSRLAAVEEEGLHAGNHPARARLHGFGVLGASNSFWRVDVLHRIRVRGRRPVPDVEASLQIVIGNGTIRTDPALLAHRLAPRTWRRHLRERLVDVVDVRRRTHRQLVRTLFARGLGMRRRVGVLHLLGWRAIQPWLTLQAFGVVGYALWRDGLPLATETAVVAGMFLLVTGPMATLLAVRSAHPDIRRNRSWFLLYLVESTLYYTELMQWVVRVAQLGTSRSGPRRNASGTKPQEQNAEPARPSPDGEKAEQ